MASKKASDAMDVQDEMPGWLIEAARGAASLGYKQIAEQEQLSTTWLQRIERMPAIKLRTERGQGAAGIEPASVERLLRLFWQCGLELRPASKSEPAAVICVNPEKLARARKANGKGPR